MEPKMPLYELHIEGNCEPDDCPYCAMEEQAEAEDHARNRKSALGRCERILKRRD